MADLAVSFMVSQVTSKLTDILIKIKESSGPLEEVTTKVEWIEKELIAMQAFTERIEHREGSTNSKELELVEDIRIVALEARDVTDTFLLKSVKRRRKVILYLYDRYIVVKKLEKIIDRMIEISKRIPNYEQANTGVGVVGAGTRTSTIVAPALEKLDYILTQNLITMNGVITSVEHVRDEDLGDTKNIVSNLNSTGGRSEREKVWLEEVKDVCYCTVSVAEKFISSRERRSRMWKLWQVLFVFEKCASEWRFKKRMEDISTEFGHALYKRWTLGDGGEDVGDKRGSRPVLSLSLARLSTANFMLLILLLALYILPLPVPFFSLNFTAVLSILGFSIFGSKPTTEHKPKKKKISTQIMTYMLFYSVDFVLFTIFYYLVWAGDRDVVNVVLLTVVLLCSILVTVIAWAVSLWMSFEENLKITRRYLVLMDALFSDIKCAQGLILLNERQKVWVNQLKQVAQKGHSLVDAYPTDSFLLPLYRIIFARRIIDLLDEIVDISDRKNNYAIANIQGPSIQGSESEIIVQVENNDDNSGTEQNSQASPPPPLDIHQKILLMRGEYQLMEALSSDTQEIGLELDGRSNIWVEQIKGIAVETKSVTEEYARKLEHEPRLIYILKFWVRHDIMGKINHIRNKIEDASRRRNAYGLVQLQSRAESLSTVRILRSKKPPSLILKQSRIVGFGEDVKVLMAQLLSEETSRCITSIVGIEGTGKSELAGMVYDNKAVIDSFGCRVWVSVSPDWTGAVFKERIASVAATVRSKKHLLVVDGIQTSDFLNTLLESIPDESAGSRFLLTTRNANVARQAGTGSFVLHLQLLDDQDSWILFTNNLSDDIHSRPKLIEDGKGTVAKCGGLPSEILRMSSLFGRETGMQKKGSSMQGLDDQGENPWSETLDIFNTSLPSYLRRCLLYFELFPADFEVPARRLVVLWVAEALVHHVEDQEPPELIAERYLMELIDLNMVQIAKRKPNGGVKTCRLPNALRASLLIKANESRFPPVHTGTDVDAVSKSSRIRQVADRLDKEDIWHKHIHGNTTNDSASLGTYYKDVLSFLSFDAQEGIKPGQDIGNFLKMCISSNCLLLLRVLDLEGVYKPKLPKDIARLTKLRYLGLRWTYLQSLPSSISNLLKLQTLDLKHTYIHTLTTSIWKMELRHLFLSDTYRTKFPSKPKGTRIGSSLSNLQTLWGLFVDEETPVNGGLDKLVNIRKLGVACQSMSLKQEAMKSQLDAIAEWIVKLEYLQSLRLKSRDEEGQPWTLRLKSLKHLINLTDMYLLGCLSNPSILSEFPPSLVELTLSHSQLKENPMQILKDLPNLQSLSLLANSYEGNTLVCNSQSFPKLYVLKVWKLEKLEEWNIEQKALPSLRQLEIRSCPLMKTLPNGLNHVNTLLELKLTNMSMGINTDKQFLPPHCDVQIDNSE